MFFVSEKKKYSRISRIFKLAFFLPKVDFFIGNDFHALLNNGLLSVDATLQALILLLKFSLITTVRPDNYDCDSANLYI